MTYTPLRCAECDRVIAALFSSHPMPSIYCLECADQKDDDDDAALAKEPK